MTAFRIIIKGHMGTKHEIYCQNRPKIEGKTTKKHEYKKIQVPDIYIFFSESSISSKLLSYTNIKNIIFDLKKKKKTQ